MAYEYDRVEREDGGGSFLMGLLAGTVLGAGLGMLFAPKAGCRGAEAAVRAGDAPPFDRDRHDPAGVGETEPGVAAGVGQDRAGIGQGQSDGRSRARRVRGAMPTSGQDADRMTEETATESRQRGAGRRSARRGVSHRAHAAAAADGSRPGDDGADRRDARLAGARGAARVGRRRATPRDMMSA